MNTEIGVNESLEETVAARQCDSFNIQTEANWRANSIDTYTL